MNVKKIIFIFILTLLLTSCGRQEAATEENNISDQYTMETISLEETIRYPVLAGDKIYYVKEDSESGYIVYCIDINGNVIRKEKLFLEDQLFHLINYTADLEGNIYFALTVKPENNDISSWENCIMKWNSEGEKEYFLKITEEIGNSFLNMKVDEQGRLCFQYDKVYYFDENGKYIGEETYVLNEEAEIQFYQQKSQFEKFGINIDEIKDIVFQEDGRIEVLVQNNNPGTYEILVLTPSETSLNEGKTELVLGVLQSNGLVRSLAADFNKDNQDVYITIREYQPLDGLRTPDEAISVMAGDILSGKGPDLISLSPGGNHTVFVEQNILEDLQPYVDQSNVIYQEDFIPGVWKCGTQENMLYAIPFRFSIQTLAGKSIILGEKNGWTVADLKCLAEKYPQSLLVDPSSKISIFSLCCTFQAEKFVDRTIGECYFDSPQFYEILEFADLFDSDINQVSDAWKYQEDQVLLMEADLYNIDSYLEICHAFGTEDLNFTGYPTWNGEPGHMISQCNDMFGISSRSNYKQEAWEFVEYYAQWDAENRYLTGFPAVRTQLEQWIAEKAESMGSDQFSAEILKEQITDMTDHAVTETGWGRETEILYEEVLMYFNGQKSISETVSTIENRIRLYLKEKQ